MDIHNYSCFLTIKQHTNTVNTMDININKNRNKSDIHILIMHKCKCQSQNQNKTKDKLHFSCHNLSLSKHGLQTAFSLQRHYTVSFPHTKKLTWKKLQLFDYKSLQISLSITQPLYYHIISHLFKAETLCFREM